ncbi:C2HC5 finger protein [Talaromyces stipitatus ATCC 10500]|uniref:C2HC5 finger protein n=1 Tax=Talaromyces stipitatus (strain ATCC 10500 / CBS 375.48 / QM 6759 / NRRL 1006) TaxID=441959 RepID=B8M4S4_TALSN|nr:C2HC5 finger protein [Talaromyces stipitatus ATCC 10500]EED19359.1 C2HC5 finger protein [Talaromyces stipitatus ATCC 10500]
MSNELVTWALPKLSNFLPLDEESLKQIITYSAGLSKEESAEHLKNLLGDAPPVLEFISSFNSRRVDSGTSTPQSGASTPRTARDDSGLFERNQVKTHKRTKAPLHNAGPPRRPENYGNVSGGYKKADLEQDYMAASTKLTILLQPELGAGSGSSSANSRNPSPTPKSNNTKAPPSAAGPLISDYLPNVKSKTSKSHRPAGSGSGSGHSTPGKGSVTTTNIADLTSAIAALEEIQSMIKELRAERGQEKMRAHNEGMHHTGGPGMTDAGGPPSKLDAAVAHRNKLLAFQAQNAQRTRVVDEAADFETPNIGSTQWMSPAQRALALKKQQKILREMEEKAKPEWEKKKTFVSLDIKGGRVVRSYHTAPSGPATPDEDEGVTEETAMVNNQTETGSSGAAFSKNPLLASGGLMRPIWKGPTDGEVGGVGKNKEVRRTWRRVQDDKDDNEQWILDGGAHGYSNDSGA